MTNEQILKIAMDQSAIDLNCHADDFCQKENKVVVSASNPNARKYLELPFSCDLVSYGNNIVASTRTDLTEFVQNYINKYSSEHCFETPNLHILNDELQKHDMRICFMAEYFLPDINILSSKIQAEYDSAYEIRRVNQNYFTDLYLPEWSNALCEKRKELDIMGVAAFDNGKLIGLAGCSADCEAMWQIGIDVLPAYRKKGIATLLTSNLALDILELGKVPFYCAAWSNIKSVRNAIKSGFRPAWVEITAKSAEFVSSLN